MSEQLFQNDPAVKVRDSKGRFATAERAYADKAMKQNKWLRVERDRYMRAWMAAADTAAHWQRKYMELKDKVEKILN